MVEFNKDFDYVILLQNIQSLLSITLGQVPVDSRLLESLCDYRNLKQEVKFLSVLYKNIEHADVDIRKKYAMAYDTYKRLYTPLIEILEKNSFDVSIMSPEIDWQNY